MEFHPEFGQTRGSRLSTFKRVGLLAAYPMSGSAQVAARRWRALALATAAILLAPLRLTPALSAEPAPQAKPTASPLAPVPRSEAVSAHAPYDVGDCKACHTRSNVKNPGPAQRPIGAVCIGCHEEIEALSKPTKVPRKFKHPGPKSACETCHNPHNAKKKSLLL